MQRPEKTRAEDVIAFVEEHWGGPCGACAIDLVGHDAVLSLLLGYADRPRCARCLAAVHRRDAGEFLADAARNVRRLACYRAGWAHADRRLAAAGPWPEARVPAALRMEAPAERGSAESAHARSGPPPTARIADSYDAGDLGCGELVLALRTKLGRLAAGELLLLTATDLGAREDLPAWCRLTGHRLVRAEPPEYLIARRPD